MIRRITPRPSHERLIEMDDIRSGPLWRAAHGGRNVTLLVAVVSALLVASALVTQHHIGSKHLDNRVAALGERLNRVRALNEVARARHESFEKQIQLHLENLSTRSTDVEAQLGRVAAGLLHATKKNNHKIGLAVSSAPTACPPAPACPSPPPRPTCNCDAATRPGITSSSLVTSGSAMMDKGRMLWSPQPGEVSRTKMGGDRSAVFADDKSSAGDDDEDKMTPVSVAEMNSPPLGNRRVGMVGEGHAAEDEQAGEQDTMNDVAGSNIDSQGGARVDEKKMEPDAPPLDDATIRVIKSSNEAAIRALADSLVGLASDADDLPPRQQFTHGTAVLIFCYQRTEELEKLLKQLSTMSGAQGHKIVVSQDVDHATVMNGNQIERLLADLQHPDVVYLRHVREAPEPPPMDEAASSGEELDYFDDSAYYAIAAHYRFALSAVLDEAGFERVVVLEDDLVLADDFFDLMEAGLRVMERDASVWTISGFNDNGLDGFATDAEAIWRSDFFSGLGWLLTAKLWHELREKWPKGFWDDWMRQPAQRKGRVTLRPEVPRSITHSDEGASNGQFLDKLYRMHLSRKAVDFASIDVGYLEKEAFDARLDHMLAGATELQCAEDLFHPRVDEGYGMTFVLRYTDLKNLGISLLLIGAIDDPKSGVPRGAYRGVVPLRVGKSGKNMVLFAPQGGLVDDEAGYAALDAGRSDQPYGDWVVPFNPAVVRSTWERAVEAGKGHLPWSEVRELFASTNMNEGWGGYTTGYGGYMGPPGEYPADTAGDEELLGEEVIREDASSGGVQRGLRMAQNKLPQPSAEPPHVGTAATGEAAATDGLHQALKGDEAEIGSSGMSSDPSSSSGGEDGMASSATLPHFPGRANDAVAAGSVSSDDAAVDSVAGREEGAMSSEVRNGRTLQDAQLPAAVDGQVVGEGGLRDSAAESSGNVPPRLPPPRVPIPDLGNV